MQKQFVIEVLAPLLCDNFKFAYYKKKISAWGMGSCERSAKSVFRSSFKTSPSPEGLKAYALDFKHDAADIVGLQYRFNGTGVIGATKFTGTEKVIDL